VLLGVLVIVAVVVWSLFYGKSRTQVTPAPTAPVSIEQPTPEAASPEPQETAESVLPPETEVTDAEEAPQDETPEPEEPPLVETAEEPTDVTAEEEPAAETVEETAPGVEEPDALLEEEAETPTPEEAAEPPTDEEEEKPSAVSGTLPKITFIDEKVEKNYDASRFFTVNRVSPCRNPFKPPPNRIMPREISGSGEQIITSVGMPVPPQGVDAGDIPLLPLPGDALGTREPVRLIGISQSGDTTTAMFAISGGDGEMAVMAHPGWLVGNDYMFIGAENGLARMFDRKSNKIIHLATGETL